MEDSLNTLTKEELIDLIIKLNNSNDSNKGIVDNYIIASTYVNYEADLLSLSNNAITLILSMLTVHEVSRVDVAYCNHKKRQKFLNILSDNPCIIYDCVKFDKEFRRVNNALIYIGSRKINILALSMNNNRYCARNGLIGLARHSSSLTSLDISNINKKELDIVGIATLVKAFNEIVSRCPSLTTLKTSNNVGVNDKAMLELARHCPGLTSLDISSCPTISYAGIINLARHCPGLTFLNMNKCRGTDDDSLEEISKHLTSLTALDIGGRRWDSNITDTGVIEISKHLTSLTAINLSNQREITDAGITEVAIHLTNLTAINLSYCCITNTGITAIAHNCNSLLVLDISYNSVNDIGITEVARHCFKLQTFNIRGCKNITDTSLTEIATHLASSLVDINVQGCKKTTDAGIIALARQCASLTHITTGRRNITETGTTEVRRLLPNIVFDYNSDDGEVL